MHGAQPVSVVALQSDALYSNVEQTVHDAHVLDVTAPSELQVCNEGGNNGGGGCCAQTRSVVAPQSDTM